MYKRYMCVCVCTHAKSLQLCLTLCDPMDYIHSGSFVHGILLAKILDWVAMPSSREFFPPRDQTHICYIYCIGRWVLYHRHHLRSPMYIYRYIHIIKEYIGFPS